jgi:NitT/TauT family transport system ATP-binding protein
VATLEIEAVSKVYGTGDKAVHALGSISLKVEDGSFVSIVGPSGAGKTTLLLCTAGLLPVTSGEIRIGGVPVAAPPGNMAVVFQDYSRSLFPWLPVQQNIELPLRDRGIDRRACREKVEEAIDAVGLGGTGRRYPWQLSGGMQQRAAIARALALSPEVLLMDEPFASVDAQTRVELEDLLLKVWREFDTTVLFITHDIDEAVYMSDRVYVLSRPPATVCATHVVALPRPRDQLVTKEDERYVHLRSEVFKDVMQPVTKTPLDWAAP